MDHCSHYDSPVGRLQLTEEDGALTGLEFCSRVGEMPDKDAATPMLEKTAAQLDEYFAGKRKIFDLPLAPKGTPFQKRVWQALCAIPYGQTCSYAKLAAAAGSPKGCRAAGMANNRNPISIIVPCHRVIGADGSLTGYGGGLDNKAFLLQLEADNA